MFAVRRIIRSNVNLISQIYTSSVVKCDKPKDTESIENKPKQKQTDKENKPKLVSNNDRKNQLIAEVDPKDYANFKSKKVQTKIELYSNTTTHEEKFEAKKELENLTKEVESTTVDTSDNEKFKNLVVPKVKKEVNKTVKSKLEESAKSVAMEFGGDVKKTECDILKYLKQWELKAEKSLKDVKGGLSEEEERERGRQFREDEMSMRGRWRGGEGRRNERMGYGREMRQDFRAGEVPDQASRQERQRDSREPSIVDVITRGKYAGMKPLGIFKGTDFKGEGPKLKTWDELEELELKVSATIPPRNYFEELIQWTEEGKLWHFPIDNDQGNEAEANVDFSEHVFLEEHLEPWCPRRGPLRHFMELVVTGLSKNFHLTVEEKKEHIFWFRDYFEGKKKLLQDMGALDGAKLIKESVESTSESKTPA